MSDFAGYELDKVTANVIPKGEYRVVITKIEKKPTKDGTGERINLVLQVVGGQYQNRTLFDGLNVKNKSDVAQNIGRSQLKKLIIAAGLNEKTAAMADIVNATMKRPIIAVVDVKDDQNVVKTYKAALPSSAAPAAPPEKNLIEQAFESPAGEEKPVVSPWK